MIQFDSPPGAPQPVLPEPPKKDKDPVGWKGIFISLLVHGVFILLAVFVLYKWVNPPVDKQVDFVPGGGGGGGNQGQTANKVQTQMRRAASTATSRRTAVEGEASFTLPDNPTELVDPGLPSIDSTLSSSGSGGGGGGGRNGGLGTGVGPGTGPGSGPGSGPGLNFANPFGSKSATEGAMPGYFYDMKQTKDGKEIAGYNPAHYEDYTTKVEDIHRVGYRESAFKKFFRAPEPLYLTQIAIPVSNAANGPSFFNVADKVKPAGWLVHYSGQVAVDRDMTFRFVGAADDYVAAFTNGHPRLIATWPGVRGLLVGRWEPKELDENGPTPVEACPVTTGEWVKMKKGELVTFDIGIGECPGGQVGFVLMVEEKDVEYRKAANGAKILPLFTTEKIKPEAKARIMKDFPNWEFEWDKVPVFPVRQKTDDL
ncbi:MAG: hypothetical protein JWO82_1812 [Akkermansiaceae bacterium]|nr:hypothetical protein [Akkermansiaceae bacterium]